MEIGLFCWKTNSVHCNCQLVHRPILTRVDGQFFLAFDVNLAQILTFVNCTVRISNSNMFLFFWVYLLAFHRYCYPSALVMKSFIQSKYFPTRVKIAGLLLSHSLTPWDKIPITVIFPDSLFLTIKGPPESPPQESETNLMSLENQYLLRLLI